MYLTYSFQYAAAEYRELAAKWHGIHAVAMSETTRRIASRWAAECSARAATAAAWGYGRYR